jgi:[acyl-carrier-protein] S-malonyltransferase
MKSAFLFPGQGSQYIGMGKDFFDTFSIARQTFEEAEDILTCKISDIIFNGPIEKLTQTKNSQLAIFINSVAILRTILQQIPDLIPYSCAGLSLGEYSALFASKMVDFETVLRLVRDRAHFMNDACERTSGTMSAVLGLNALEIDEIIKPISIEHQVWVANYNCPNQTVISGSYEGVKYASNLLKQKGAKKVLPLVVHGAFHSGFMQEAQYSLAPKIMKAKLSLTDVKLLMNVTGDFVYNLDQVRKNLIDQITSSVRWEQSIEKLKADAIDLYIEIGCGKTLSGMNRKMNLETFSVDSVLDLDVLINKVESIFC